MSYDEVDLYTGLAALHWSTISDTDPRVDQAFYKQVIERNGGRALELGCGAGRLLLAEEIHSGQGRWYFRNELLWMLELAGFRDVAVKGDFTEQDYNAEHSITMVFVATKQTMNDEPQR